ncbi:hypothetical protein LUZ60_012493 [Juncus effusus]|nr:hypothetical protein LUZ60_012493 [Juncus effusus]
MSDDLSSSIHSDSHTAIKFTSLIIAGLILLAVLATFICSKCKRHPERNNTVMAEPIDMESSEIELTYPSFAHKTVSNGSKECSVCFTKIHDGVIVREVPVCKHVFHTSCTDTWLTSNKNCSLCRCNIQVSCPSQATDPESSNK